MTCQVGRKERSKGSLLYLLRRKLGRRQRCSELLGGEKSIFPFAGVPKMTVVWRSLWPSDQLSCTACCLRPFYVLNPLTPKGHHSGRTAPLTSKSCILYIYSTSIGTEYFKHGIYSPFLSLQNEVCFIIITYLVPLLFTFYIFIQQI